MALIRLFMREIYRVYSALSPKRRVHFFVDLAFLLGLNVASIVKELQMGIGTAIVVNAWMFFGLYNLYALDILNYPQWLVERAESTKVYMRRYQFYNHATVYFMMLSWVFVIVSS